VEKYGSRETAFPLHDETKSMENMKSEYEKKIQDLYAEVGRLNP